MRQQQVTERKRRARGHPGQFRQAQSPRRQMMLSSACGSSFLPDCRLWCLREVENQRTERGGCVRPRGNPLDPLLTSPRPREDSILGPLTPYHTPEEKLNLHSNRGQTPPSVFQSVPKAYPLQGTLVEKGSVEAGWDYSN